MNRVVASSSTWRSGPVPRRAWSSSSTTVRSESTGGEVTYRGVPVGRVGPIRLVDRRVEVELRITAGAPPIPADLEAVVANRSAVGEQYVDLRPRGAD
ncbi:MlaD family protein, partial [Saccharothrix sp. MB29]|nr:MlaD family protein [Saccharothrix sp. MB29]